MFILKRIIICNAFYIYWYFGDARTHAHAHTHTHTCIVLYCIVLYCIVLYCIGCRIIPESARWLLSTGRIANAKYEINRMARMNKVEKNGTLIAFESLLVQEVSNLTI